MGAQAQWLNSPTPGTPRTRDGKPNLAAPLPRTLDGKADLSGVWHVHPTPLAEMKRLFGKDINDTSLPGMERDQISKYAINLLVDFKPEESPLRPEAVEIMRERTTRLPSETCQPLGIPLSGLLSVPIKIVQSPRLIAILFEAEDRRQIYIDGRSLPKEVIQPAWLGYSVGKWEGDTLIVNTAGFNDKSWFDLTGHPHSEALSVAERFHRRDFGHMDVDITLDDPKMYTRPISIKLTYDLWADSDIFEFVCSENERDHAHIVND
jgi:hypothetical protein